MSLNEDGRTFKRNVLKKMKHGNCRNNDEAWKQTAEPTLSKLVTVKSTVKGVIATALAQKAAFCPT